MDVEVSWDPVALQEQSAFIQGYILYYWENNSSVVNISTGKVEFNCVSEMDTA